ncbi:hypothetical protein ACHAXM_000485 [Skeletonema potamos]|jgi:hypothetical protein
MPTEVEEEEEGQPTPLPSTAASSPTAETTKAATAAAALHSADDNNDDDVDEDVDDHLQHLPPQFKLFFPTTEHEFNVSEENMKEAIVHETKPLGILRLSLEGKGRPQSGCYY